MSNPTPAQNRSKRPLSPSADSPPRDRTRFAPYCDKPFSNTPKPAPTNASATRAKMIALEPDQKDELLKTLFDLHPSARESIAAVLPSITSAPLPASMISKSVYFGDEVAWCHEYLNNYNWPNNPKLPARGSCEGAGSVLENVSYVFEGQFDSFYCTERSLPKPDCDKAVYSMDATIAILEIGLVAFERQKAAGKHELTCRPMIYCHLGPGVKTAEKQCEVESSLYMLGKVWMQCVLPRPPNGIANSIRSERFIRIGNGLHFERYPSPKEVANDLAEWEAWHIAIRYSTPDNRSHPLREILLRYIDLPPILPHPGPNDNALPETDDWLRPRLEGLGASFRKGQMPDRRPGPVLDLGGMSIS